MATEKESERAPSKNVSASDPARWGGAGPEPPAAFEEPEHPMLPEYVSGGRISERYDRRIQATAISIPAPANPGMILQRSDDSAS